MRNRQVHFIELQVGVPLPQSWPWRAVVLAIAAVVLILFLWSMPAWAGVQINGTEPMFKTYQFATPAEI